MAAWSPAAAALLLHRIRGIPLLHCAQRMFASQTEGELKVTQILKENFPQATTIKVTDISDEPREAKEPTRSLTWRRRQTWNGNQNQDPGQTLA
ncbi:bolA-like protein 3 isoform X2 [Desmodus rotundus]|uniref:bolA-like protein 3 isoform X2 n=1 Tax=Desmodus rotundus TaxID=9430 RepID=UPI0023811401|nr:bolA-like protein 3 isoform X2 [Desmodus rotundus]